jgi:predicted N-formylglutamate amidohydrolase
MVRKGMAADRAFGSGGGESGSQPGVGRLLGPADIPPLMCINPQGSSPFLLIGDHAGKAIPRSLGDLGLGEADRTRHIAWDIGVRALGEALAPLLDAVFLYQPYSRLVIDCNRDPASPEAVPAASDGTPVPGNAGLDGAARAARVAEIHAPYQQAIATEIARRDARGQATLLVSLHSFTATLAGGRPRPWDIGILHDGHEEAFALRLLRVLEARGDLIAGDNEPYRMDATDYTVPRHAFPARPYVELEVAQRRLGDAASAGWWAGVLAAALTAAL